MLDDFNREGLDILVGGAGDDVFRFDVAAETTTAVLVDYTSDIISDFEIGVDHIELYGAAWTDVEINAVSNKIIVNSGAGDLFIELTGVDLSLISQSDFIFS